LSGSNQDKNAVSANFNLAPAFWKKVPLQAMTQTQWESLCDGCARCCLIKLVDEETGKLHFTNVACYQLDITTCRCTHYRQRTERVANCVAITPEDTEVLGGLPDTCAYAKLLKGESLAGWHPLLSGDQESVVRAGISIQGFAISEQYVHADQLEEHVIDWVVNTEGP